MYSLYQDYAVYPNEDSLLISVIFEFKIWKQKNNSSSAESF